VPFNVASTGERRSRESERSDRAWPCYNQGKTLFFATLNRNKPHEITPAIKRKENTNISLVGLTEIVAGLVG